MQRIALVTGSSRGIGKAIALRLAANGMAVAVNYRERRQEAEAVAAQIRELGVPSAVVQADIACKEEALSLASRVEDALGPVDVLVNNAGIIHRGDLLDFDFAQMEGMRAVNVDGLVRVTQAVVPGMQKRQGGRIVNLASIAAIGTSMAGTTFYAATKAAVIALTRRFALQLGPSGITVNAIAPGFILTDMVAGSKESFDAIAARTMMRRVGTPEDIASAVGFLTSEEASFITAQLLTVDGGRTDYIAHP